MADGEMGRESFDEYHDRMCEIHMTHVEALEKIHTTYIKSLGKIHLVAHIWVALMGVGLGLLISRFLQ